MKYAIINGILLDGKKDMVPQYDRTLFIDGEKIEKISDGKDAIPEGYKVIDAQGMYILPGLINMHVHLAGNGRPQKKQRDNAKLVKLLFSNPVSAKAAEMMVAGYAKIELMSGVTTIRTVGGLKDLDTKLRDAIDSGKKDGPRILAANEGISVPGGHVSRSLPKFMSLELVIPSNHLIVCHPLLFLPLIFPSIRIFANELALCIR